MQFDIRRFDIYRKVPKDLTQPTTTGALISISSIIFIIYLFVSELLAFLSVELVSEVYVDDPVKSTEMIPVTLNISLPNMDCKYLGLDIQDDLGRHDVGFVTNTLKEPTRDKLGCLFSASFHINKVSGNFHVSTHSANEQPDNPDFTHVIHNLAIGAGRPPRTNKKSSFRPLNGRDETQSAALSTHDYFLKIVPTISDDQSGKRSFPYQFTSLHRSYVSMGHGHSVMPAIWFRYDLSPVVVKYKEKRIPLYHFLTNICAIIGGTFTVASILDSMIFTASELLKKVEIGKLS